MERENITISNLKDALINTATHRHTLDKMVNYLTVFRSIVADDNMQANWVRYQQNNRFAQAISLEATCVAGEQLMHEIAL